MERREFLISAVLGTAAIVTLYNPLSNLLDSFIKQRIEKINESELEKILSKIDKKRKEKLRGYEEEIKENLVDIHTVTDYVTKLHRGEKKSDISRFGGGLIYNNYILTMSHVATFNKASFVGKKWKNISRLGRTRISKQLEYKIIGESNHMGELGGLIGSKEIGGHKTEKVINIPEKDLAVLKLPKKYPKPKNKVRLGDSDNLRTYDEVYLIGNPYGKGVVTRPGMMGNSKIIKYPNFLGGKIASMSSREGDSGFPLINKDGEVIGLLSGAYVGAYSLFIPINWYKEEIAKYEERQK